LLGVDESDETAATRDDQFALVLEHDLDDLVSVAKEDGLASALPLFDVAEIFVLALALWCILFCEVELKWLEFLIAVQVTLKVLQENNLLVDRLRIVEEVKV